MKLFFTIITSIILSFNYFNLYSQTGVSINNTGQIPDASAILDISSDNKGILLPRMTEAERNAIINPASGLLIYNSTSKCFEFYENSVWQTVHCACSTPLLPSAISGPANPCQEATGLTYSVVNTPGITYTWAYSGTGLSISGDTTVNSITVDFSAGATSGDLTIFGTNACGTSPVQTLSITISTCYICSSTKFTDTRDGKVYGQVDIAGSSSPYCLGSQQTWMCQNLNTGTQISSISGGLPQDQTDNSIIEKYCYTDKDSLCRIYGGMYQWDELMNYGVSVGGNGPGPQGICPPGWHVPTDNEWKCLEMNLGMIQATADVTGWRNTMNESAQLKEAGTIHWSSPNTGTNSSGFTAFAGGRRDAITGSFLQLKGYGWWWTATEGSATNAYARGARYDHSMTSRENPSKINTYSLHCVKD